MTIEELLQTPCWVVDFLPRQVPANSAGQFFAVEKYYLEKERMAAIKKKHIDLILKLNCYCDIYLDDEAEKNPAPERIAREIAQRHLCIRTEDALIMSEPDEPCLAVFHPDEALLSLLRLLAAGEGLYVWQP